VPINRSAEAARSPTHGQSENGIVIPTPAALLAKRGTLADRGGSVLKTSLNSKVTAFWKASSLPLCAATRRRPLQRDGTRSSMIVFGWATTTKD